MTYEGEKPARAKAIIADLFRLAEIRKGNPMPRLYRQRLAFTYRIFADQLGLTDQEQREGLARLNSLFLEPLGIADLYEGSKPRKVYHPSCSALLDRLGITDEEGAELSYIPKGANANPTERREREDERQSHIIRTSGVARMEDYKRQFGNG